MILEKKMKITKKALAEVISLQPKNSKASMGVLVKDKRGVIRAAFGVPQGAGCDTSTRIPHDLLTKAYLEVAKKGYAIAGIFRSIPFEKSYGYTYFREKRSIPYKDEDFENYRQLKRAVDTAWKDCFFVTRYRCGSVLAELGKSSVKIELVR